MDRIGDRSRPDRRLEVLALIGAIVLGAGSSIARAGDADVEARLRALEDANRKLLQRYEQLLERSAEDRKLAEDRYRDLERRYLELRGPGVPPAIPAANESRDPQTRPAELDGASQDDRIPIAAPGFGARDGATASETVPALPLIAELRDGFELRTVDDEISLRFHTLAQVDFKDFLPNTQSPARSGLYIPRVRVYFEGDLTRLFDYEISLQRSVEGVWDLLDGNIDYKPSEKFQVRFGRTLVPYSYDWYDHLEQYFITPERGLFPLNFGLSRAAGLLAQGWLFDRRLEYAFGGFDGRLTGVADNNNTRDGVVYVNLRPFLLDEDSPWRYLNIGGSAFSGSQIAPQDPLPMRTSLQSSENDEAASSASAVFLEFDEGVSALGSRAAGALHLAWYRGPFSFESEVQAGRFQFLPHHGERRVGVPVMGYHIAGSWFLTGEEVSERTTVVPLRPFDLRPGSRGPGAFEVFARFSHLLLGEQVFTGELADPNRWTRRVDMPEVGFNWYPNRFIKFYVDWQLPIYGSPVATDYSGRRTTRNGNMFWIRAQVYF